MNNPENPNVEQTEGAESPADVSVPFFKTWRRAYLVVLSELALLIILFYFFARSFQ